MKVGTEDKKKLILAGVFGVVAICCLGYLYTQFFGGPSTPPPAPAAVVAAKPAPAKAANAGGSGPSATKVGTVNLSLDPTLHMEQMEAAESLVYSGTGRNIFAPGAQQAPAPTPVKIEQAKFPVRPGPQLPPTPPQPAGPPPINLKFFGIATQDGVRRALLLSGEDVFLASPGEIVQRRYKIVTIAANSITVEDMPNSNKQTLPLQVN